MPILLKLFKKIEEDRTLPNSLYEATITLIPKPDKNNTKKRNLQANLFDEYRCKNPQQNISRPNPTIYKKDQSHDQMGFIPGCKDVSTFTNQSM